MALRKLLTNKGYSFAEELDLGLLDKQYRRPFALAETDPPPKNKKRRKQDPFGEDDDENGDDMDARNASSDVPRDAWSAASARNPSACAGADTAASTTARSSMAFGAMVSPRLAKLSSSSFWEMRFS